MIKHIYIDENEKSCTKFKVKVSHGNTVSDRPLRLQPGTGFSLA